MAVATASAQPYYRQPTYPTYDYTYSTSGNAFFYELKPVPVIEVNGVEICEYTFESGKKITYKADELGVSFGGTCPAVRFAALTTWEPYVRKGRSINWVCAYGEGTHNHYMFRFVDKDCPDLIIGLSMGMWLESAFLGGEFVPEDFGKIPPAVGYYNLNTLENNPRFADRVKYRAGHGLLIRLEP